MRPGGGERTRILAGTVASIEPIAAVDRSPAVLRPLAGLYYDQAEGRVVADQLKPASEWIGRALGLYDEVAKSDPSELSTRGVANTLGLAAYVLMLQGGLEDALAYQHRRLDLRLKTRQGAPHSLPARRGVALVYLSIAEILGDPVLPNLGRFEEARRYTEMAVTAAREIAGADRADRTAQYDLGLAEAQASRILLDARPAEALGHARRASALSGALLKDSPGDLVYVRDWLHAQVTLGRALNKCGATAEARQVFSAAIAKADSIPNPPASHRKRRGECLGGLGLIDRDPGPLQRALADLEQHYLDRRESLDETGSLSTLYEAAGILLDRKYLQKAVALWEEWPRHGKSGPFDQRRLAHVRGLAR